jgi:hypothetical protein
MGQLPDAPNRKAHVIRIHKRGQRSPGNGDDTKPGRNGGWPQTGGGVSGKAVISLATGLEDPEKVTVAFLVAVGAAGPTTA